MRKIILILLAVALLQFQSTAQMKDSVVHHAPGKSIFKINLSALIVKNYSFQYELAIGRKTSVALGYRFMSNSNLPFKESIKNSISDPDTKKQVDNFTTSNSAFTPEIRFYLGKKGVFHGFYLAPFARISQYKANMPNFKYTVGSTEETISLSGKLNTTTGGLLLGAQWSLGKSIYLDWWILGPNGGGSNGFIEGKQALNSTEQDAFRKALQDLSIPFTHTNATVDANGGRLDMKGSWAGFRSGGLCLGIRF